jgi:phosphatidylinositol alpha-1,6-mannosyltransferase
MQPNVLFVSKPIVAPFHDGTKCLVRDVARELGSVRPTIMTVSGAAPLLDARGEAIEAVPVYGSPLGFAPPLLENLRAALYVLARSRADVWHFVFAPNPRTSRVGRLLKRARRVPVVQTVASPPRCFADMRTLLFGDIIVAQSAWTAARIRDACEREGLPCPELEIVPPPVQAHLSRTPEGHAKARAALDIAAKAPLFVYPGDIELSAGAENVARAVHLIARDVPGAVVVFAYRQKTPLATGAAEELAQRLDPKAVRFVGSIPDVLDLVSGAAAVLFPVDDLFGKVDLPIVLLEAMSLGVPVVAAEHGPLPDLRAACFVPLGDPAALARTARELFVDAALRQVTIERQRTEVERRFRADVVAARYEALYIRLCRARGRKTR